MTGDPDRLRNIIEKDSRGAVNDTLRVLRSDIAALLGEFGDVSWLDIRATASDGGAYRLTVEADLSCLYSVGIVGGE